MHTTITLTTANLIRAFAAVQHHAAPEKLHLPVLNTVHAYINGDTLVTEATDRYRIARATTNTISATVEAPETLIPLGTVTNLLRALKPLSKTHEVVTLSWYVGAAVKATRIRVHAGDDVVFGETFDTIENAYPDLNNILENTFTSDHDNTPAEGYAVNPEYLGDFWRGIKQAVPAKDRHGRSLWFRSLAPGKPLAIAYDDWFIGALMPVRINPDDNPAETGRHIATLTPQQPAKADA